MGTWGMDVVALSSGESRSKSHHLSPTFGSLCVLNLEDRITLRLELLLLFGGGIRLSLTVATLEEATASGPESRVGGDATNVILRSRRHWLSKAV